MASLKYEKLQQDAVEADAEDLLPGTARQRILLFSRDAKVYSNSFIIVIVLSLLCNAFLLFQAIHLSSKLGASDQSPLTDYVGLRADLPVPFDEAEGSLYDAVWNSPQMSDSLGIVALSEEYVKANNLPKSMRFPWDQTKSVYVLSYHHNIHCLRYLRQSVLESHTGREQSMGLEHLTHCLIILLEDTMCHADDTPRYTGRMHSQHNITRPQAGIGQNRKCRDFNKLYEWSIDHSACYADAGPDKPAEDYFKFCPDGRKLWD